MAYEVLWARDFTTLFGATPPAAAATLSAVFLGLAAGSIVMGRACARLRRPLRAYGWLELAAAASAVLLRPLPGLYEHIVPLLPAGGAATFAAKLALAAAVVLPPTFFLGGTLPVMVQAATERTARLGVIGASLNASNILGAAAGALAVPFLLLPWFGVQRSFFVAAAISATAGSAALLLSRNEKTRSAQTLPVSRGPGRIGPWVVAGAFLSGALHLALEASFTRLFGLIHESSVHAFASVLALFLLGLVAGNELARRLLRSKVDPRRAVGAIWTLAGALAVATPLLFRWATDGLCPLEGDMRTRMLELLKVALSTLLPVSILAGAVLPFLLELARARTENFGSAAGMLLGANMLGAIVGPLAATFVGFGILGLFGTLVAIGAGMSLAGAGALAGHPATGRQRNATIGGLVVTLIFVLTVRPYSLPCVYLDEEAGERLLWLAQGDQGIVAVVGDPGGLRLKLDNHYTLGGTAVAGDERMLGHVPLLLHPEPRSVAFLGLGTGITAAAACAHPLERIVVAELVPEVADAAALHFGEANAHVLDDPRVELVADDARTFLRRAPAQFDVIVGDLVVPWRAGEAALYTREHFAAAQRALRPGGLFCQWLPVYQLRETEFDAVVATFLDVFGEAIAWRGDFMAELPTVGLVGWNEGMALDPSSIDARVADIAPRLDRLTPYLADPAGLWLFLLGPLSEDEERFAGARRHDAAHPWLELAGPFHHGDSRDAADRLFGGPAFERFLDDVRTRSLQGTPLSALDESHRRYRDAGAVLWRASRMVFDGRGEEARQLALTTLRSLPSRLEQAVVGR